MIDERPRFQNGRWEGCDEDDEIWGKLYDVGEAEIVWVTQSSEYDFYQYGHWLEILFQTKNKNWFLYTKASKRSNENVYGGRKGASIYPFDEFEVFKWLEEKRAEVDVFEKYFPEKIIEA